MIIKTDANFRKIPALKLAKFIQPEIEGNRNVFARAGWYVCSALLFQGLLLSLLPNRAKAAILRVFGAKVGRGFVCKPRVTIKYPWFLVAGDFVWLGEGVWIDNTCAVTIGSNVCVSQGVRIFTGNHDWSDPAFAYFGKPVTVGDGVWITAFQVVGPGAQIPSNVVVRLAGTRDN